MEQDQENIKNRLEDALKTAQQKGATASEVVFFQTFSHETSCRLGKKEDSFFSHTHHVNLRIVHQGKQVVLHTQSLEAPAFHGMIDEALAIAKKLPTNPFCGLEDPHEQVQNAKKLEQTLEMSDLRDIEPNRLEKDVEACEKAALDVSLITNSASAWGKWKKESVVRATSNGFFEDYKRSCVSMGVGVIAGHAHQQQSESRHTNAVFYDDLRPPQEIGQEAAQGAVRRLNPQKISTCQVPVVFENLISCSLLEHFLQAISGKAILQKASFLLHEKNQQIFPPDVQIIDDPLKKRGVASRPFDGEGLATRPINLVEDGVLKSWLLNLEAARQLRMPSTGHATFSLGGAPGVGPSNAYIDAGLESLKELLDPIDEGLFVTDIMGFGANILTGDYSVGARGFWIEKGVVSYPVQGLTVAGNLREIFCKLTPANDLVFQGALNAPSLRVSHMTVAAGT